MDNQLSKRTTEQRNEKSRNLDLLSVKDIISLMNDEDQTVALSVRNAIPQIEQAIERIVVQLKEGGRLFYIGAGTSGRLGVLDASECPPTFGVEKSLVNGIIAGGPDALTNAIENAEDDESAGSADAQQNIKTGDALVGIAASGHTPYVIGAVRAANTIGAVTIGISCNIDTPLSAAARYPIEIAVGPEVVTGSTRLKAGTAQKMVLNMITTASMIRLGKVYGNLMVNVQATNQKLRDRAVRTIMEATGADFQIATTTSDLAGGDVRAAVLMIKYQIGLDEALAALLSSSGHFGKAID